MSCAVSHCAPSLWFQSKLINMIQKMGRMQMLQPSLYAWVSLFVPLYCAKLFNWVSLIVRRHRKEHRPLFASIQATIRYQIQFPSKRQAAVELAVALEINEDLHQGKTLVWDGRFLPNKRHPPIPLPVYREQKGPWKEWDVDEIIQNKGKHFLKEEVKLKEKNCFVFCMFNKLMFSLKRNKNFLFCRI